MRVFIPAPLPHTDQTTAELKAIKGDSTLSSNVTVAYSDIKPEGVPDPPVLILIHGNPVASRSMMGLAAAFPGSFRILVPDLPGVGRSSRIIPDYSSRAHGHYLIQLLDTLQIYEAHLVGYSLGGAVALQAYEKVPERIQSITMLSAVGVQELELLGDYLLNHGVHSLQLGFLWLVQEGLPHFGYLDDAYFNTSYAKIFYDTDQRPLRDILRRFEPPMLIQHGREDFQIPYAAAEEHARIVPQSRLISYEGGHIVLFAEPHTLAQDISGFIRTVEQGTARTRSNADNDRIIGAGLPYNPSDVPETGGLSLVLTMVLIALATLASEDITCIGAGLMVTRGVITFIPATIACLLGIYGGDILLYLAGRFVGKPALRRAPLKWFIKADKIRRGTKWIERQGAKFVVASRFIPGSRLPTYVGAGVLGMSFWRFSAYMLIAAILWTPILVGFSAFIGNGLSGYFDLYMEYAFPVLVGVVLSIWLVIKIVVPLFSYKGRRMWIGRWRRIARWEFWPPYVFYLPLLPYIIHLAFKHRSLAVFTAVNPAIMDGGFIGESKSEILNGLKNTNDYVAVFAVIAPDDDVTRRLLCVRAFMNEEKLHFPIVLKPDIGERGRNVKVVRSDQEISAYLSSTKSNTIVQAYKPGYEFGVFYFRYPGQSRGEILSITEKRFPVMVGDGRKTIERLILDDDRAVCMASFYINNNIDRADEIPKNGEEVQLVEIGTHCLGAIFLDGKYIKTPALENVIDRISKDFVGFFFGRYDIRTPSIEALMSGRDFSIVELNGVTSEATHIYDPANRLLYVYRVLREQWRIAFEIGAKNVENGARITPVRTLIRKLIQYKAPGTA